MPEEVRLPQLPPAGLRGSASEPSLVRSVVVADEGEDASPRPAFGCGMLPQLPCEAIAVPACAMNWLPALRPLTGCANFGYQKSLDGSLCTTARSHGVCDIPSGQTSCRTAASKALQPGMTKSASMPSLGGPQKERVMLRGMNIAEQSTLQNQRAQRSMHCLVAQGTLQRKGPDLPRATQTSSIGFFERADEANFVRKAETMEKAMLELKSGMDGFNPSQQKNNKKLFGSSTAEKFADSKPKAASERKRDGEGNNERFEAYKMVRKIEPEMPPLQRLSPDDDPIPPKTPPEQGIIVRNAESSVLHSWSPAARKVRLIEQKDARELKTKAILSRGLDTIEENAKMYAGILQQKALQAESALKEKKTGRKDMPAKYKPFAKEWCQWIVTMTFAKRARAILQKGKLQGGRKATNFQALADVAARATDKDGHTKGMGCFAVLSFMAKTKLQIQTKRQQAKMVALALKSWDPAGKILLQMQTIAHRIRKLQRCWRDRSRLWKEIRLDIGRRWEQLERQELTKEHSTRILGAAPGAANAPAKDDRRKARRSVARGSVASACLLGVEDYINAERIHPEVREKFLTYELRARRYYLLPRLELWKEDCKQWHKNVHDHVDDAVAVKVVGAKHEKEASMFSWPPTRPSYLPPLHPSSEARGAPCAENCCGRKGDAEILDMIKRAREARDKDPFSINGGGWLEIPQRCRQGEPGLATKTRGAGKGGRGGKDRAQADPADSFGEEVSDKEMRAWGLDGSEMPCLADTGSPMPLSAI